MKVVSASAHNLCRNGRDPWRVISQWRGGEEWAGFTSSSFLLYHQKWTRAACVQLPKGNTNSNIRIGWFLTWNGSENCAASKGVPICALQTAERFSTSYCSPLSCKTLWAAIALFKNNMESCPGWLLWRRPHLSGYRVQCGCYTANSKLAGLRFALFFTESPPAVDCEVEGRQKHGWGIK